MKKSGSLQYVLMDLREVTFFDIDGLEVIKSLHKFCTKKNNLTFGIRTQRHRSEACHSMLQTNHFFSNQQLQDYLENQDNMEDDDLCFVLEKLQEETPEQEEKMMEAPMEEKEAADDDYKQEA